MQCSDSLNLTIDGITDREKSRRIKSHTYTCRSPHAYDRTRKKFHSLGQFSYAVGDVKYKVIGVPVLSKYPIDIRFDLQARSARYLIRCDDPWSDRGKAVKALAQIPLSVTGLHVSCADIVEDRISENVVIRILPPPLYKLPCR